MSACIELYSSKQKFQEETGKDSRWLLVLKVMTTIVHHMSRMSIKQMSRNPMQKRSSCKLMLKSVGSKYLKSKLLKFKTMITTKLVNCVDSRRVDY
mmetsp:Transcript_4770/g.11322  ORF Transcript_4770/g.11322 Transcript_4770/m.11322 type:complete len:96 (+) Transcript_4770:1069-1356(+)